MYRWLVRRLLISVPVLLGISVLSFVFVRLAPGDPVRMMVNPEYMAGGAEEYIARRRAELGLDQPLPVQYVAWLSEVARGNLGYSFFDRRPVGDIIKERVVPTVELMGTALLLALVIGVPLGLLAVIRQEYLTTARSKGLHGRLVITRHALPNALIPLITVIGIQVPALFAGAVVVEQIFSWPGMGQLALASITQRDYPVLMGFTMLIAVLVLCSNLLADIAYAVVDPR